MRSRVILLLLAGVLLSGNVVACSFCAGAKGKGVRAKTTIAAAQEDDYDVQYIKLELNATNASTAVSGKATTVARVEAPLLTEYYYELSDQLTVDSARLNGQPVTATQLNNVVGKLTLNDTLPQHTVFTVDIYYHGAPVGGTGFFTNGILNQSDVTVPVQVTHTVSAALHSRDWWPCKQSLTDKIDSADFWITVPAGLRVAGNGVLTNVTPMTGGFNRYEWAERYPADYYLLSFSIAPYTEYNYFMHFPGSTDSMLIQNYIYDSPSVLQQHQDELDSIGHLVNYFSSLFGKYPFAKEKFGICMTPLPGGMENQTMVSLGSLDMTLIAHELSHQWWGDHVTCQSLHDMWLNEGMATYAEQLFIEHFHGKAAMVNYRKPVHNNATSALAGSVYVDDTTQESRIYSGRLTYNKGAGVAHMLRYLIDNDSVYFKILRDFQQQYSFATATTEDFKALAEQVSQMDLDTFFHQWVYMEGYPTHSAKWAQSGGQVVIRLVQTPSKPSSVSVFKIPVDIMLKSPQGDTVIRVLNDHSVQYYTFSWNKPMSGMDIDPDDHIMNRKSLLANDPGILGLADPIGRLVEVFPNPAATSWQVRNLPLRAGLLLTDISGRKIWEGVANSDSIAIPCGHLRKGSYILTVHDGKIPASFHLSR